MNISFSPRDARKVLVGIRSCVGVGSLVAPRKLGALFGVDVENNEAAIYPLRLFGARELFMAAPFVLGASEEINTLALQGGIAVDGADVLAATAAGATGGLEKRSAVMAGAVAVVAVGLGIYALTTGSLRGMPLRFVIIGGGPAGVAAATYAARLGAEVTLIERDVLGGAANLWDCIPSKAMIATGATFNQVGAAGGMGVRVADSRWTSTRCAAASVPSPSR